MSDRPVLPEGQESFKTNEVCKLARVQPYMLKYWESYFSGLEAETTGTGQRLYTRQQVELILEVARLLSEESLTLPGARKRIEAMQAGEGQAPKKGSGKKTPDRAVAPTPAESSKESSAENPPKEGKEVDKTPPDDVKPLLAALREIREDLKEAVAELRK